MLLIALLDVFQDDSHYAANLDKYSQTTDNGDF